MAHHPIVTGSVGMVDLLVAVLTLVLNSRNSDVTNRPYIGPIGNEVTFFRCGVQGCAASPPETANILRYRQILKNTGNIPAEKATAQQHVYVGDEEIIPFDGNDHPTRIMPGTVFEYPGEIGMLYYPDVVSGKKKLYIEMTVSYEWSGGSEKRCYENRYSRELQRLQEFGECASWTHTPPELHLSK
jgi:hypothetical protein